LVQRKHRGGEQQDHGQRRVEHRRWALQLAQPGARLPEISTR
jgi:hypothetical protein